MPDICASTRAYETWLTRRLGDELVPKDLERKHRKMGTGAFPFLRATYWRCAETVLETCPDLADAPEVLAVGDIHIENFGTWRDAEGRLVWGVNDFDEAETMPCVLDLVRLAASALVARAGTEPRASAVCAAILDGYRQGLSDPTPFILEMHNGWLRELVVLPEPKRPKFWHKIAELADEMPPARFVQALTRSVPGDAVPKRFARRTAGTGSLGRPRFVLAASWRGGSAIREAKSLLPSGLGVCARPAGRGDQGRGDRLRPVPVSRPVLRGPGRHRRPAARAGQPQGRRRRGRARPAVAAPAERDGPGGCQLPCRQRRRRDDPARSGAP